MSQNKRYAVLLVFLSVIGVAALHTPIGAAPEEFVLLFQGYAEKEGVMLVESIRPIQLALVPVNGTPIPSEDEVLQCSQDVTRQRILLLDGLVQRPATLTSILLRCRTGVFRVKGFRFK